MNMETNKEGQGRHSSASEEIDPQPKGETKEETHGRHTSAASDTAQSKTESTPESQGRDSSYADEE